MGFAANHEERDKGLPLKLQALKKAINNDLLNDPNVLAVFYSGSIGKGNFDLYSDLDLRIVVKEEMFEEYRKNKKERAKRWGEVLFYEDFPWASHSVAHYRSFVKIDSFYYKPNDLQPSIYLKQETQIEYDPFGIVEEALYKSQSLHYRVTEGEFEIWRGKFFAHMHEVYRRVMRREMYYALSSLDMMRWSIAAGWDMERDRIPNQMGEWSKYEGTRSQLESWQLTLLENWNCDRDLDRIMNVSKSINSEFMKIHSKLCEKLGLEENPNWINEIMGLVE